MSEIRQNRMTGDWVIVAHERKRRPQQHRAGVSVIDRLPRYDPTCPFCPGNEQQLPGIVVQTAVAEAPGWQVRIVPNKYPVVRPDGLPPHHAASVGIAIEGYGHHEVVIECPRHDADLVTMSDAEIFAVLSACRHRVVALFEKPKIEAVILFRNHGTSSGASLLHPHTQLVALSMVPQWLRLRSEWSQQQYTTSSRCIICDEMEREQIDGTRIVEATQSFLALVPFAASVPFEVWLVPKRHQASFTQISESELADLTGVLRMSLQRLNAVHGNVPYNLVVDSACTSEMHMPHIHWRARIVPDLVTLGGFELGTRLPINPSSPEEDAASLRNVTGASVI
jgi:UDPglucose--hexose-1-phosphate uridylyltransferase